MSMASQGNKPKYYDYSKALKLAKQHKVKTVGFFMACDRLWTYDDLTLTQIRKHQEVAGIKSSIWATPMIEINGEEIECWTYKKQ